MTACKIGHVAGIVTEFNPLHGGHVRLMEETRRILGPDTAIVCCMSGDFVQRGDMAVIRRRARAEAAVMSGADLVIELPLPWAVSSAEGFAEGGVSLLLGTGLVDTMIFGSECGNIRLIRKTAEVLLRDAFPAALRRELAAGISYPAARQRAVETLAGTETAAVLSQPNDLLAVEYCKSLLRHGSAITPVAVPRTGAGHDAVWTERESPESGDKRENFIPETEQITQRKAESEQEREKSRVNRENTGENRENFVSSSAIRALLRRGEWEYAVRLMEPAMRECYRKEASAGRAPVFYETVERACLARLRMMTRDELARFDEGREGLSNRVYHAVQDAVSMREILDRARTKRYPAARLRRMLLWACLNLTVCPDRPLYLRPLAMNHTGRNLLARMRHESILPVLTKAGDVRLLGQECQALLEQEARAESLYALAYPDLKAGQGVNLWTEPPWTAPEKI